MKGISTSKVAAVLAALAQPTRLRIIDVIAAGDAEGTPAGVIAREVACPASTLSFHLKELAQAGLLEPRPRGRFILYALVPASFAGLAEFVARLPGAQVVPVAAAAGKEQGKAKSKTTRKGGGRGDPGRVDPATADVQLSIFSE